jgi:hypothetical protein
VGACPGLDARGDPGRQSPSASPPLQLAAAGCGGGNDQADTSGCDVQPAAIQKNGALTVTTDGCLLDKQMDRTTAGAPIEATAEMKAAPLRTIAAKTSTLTLTLAAPVSPAGGSTGSR